MASQVNNFSLSELNWQKNHPRLMSGLDHQKDSGNSDFGKDVAVGNNGFQDFAEAKTWNFRPRKPLRRLSNGNDGAGHESKAETRQQLDVITKTHQVKKEKKQKFSVLLTHEEIENDIFLMTGGRPSRRPRKRAKTVQKQLDSLLPGSWLSAVTPDCYKVHDPPIKG
ncbi:hypothetical protein ACET3Z_031397 [Daucus carota]